MADGYVFLIDVHEPHGEYTAEHVTIMLEDYSAARQLAVEVIEEWYSDTLFTYKVIGADVIYLGAGYGRQLDQTE